MLCPRCDSLLVVQRPSTSLLDRLLSLVSLYPFQCQSCTYRFRMRQRKAHPSTVAVERRQFHRIPVQIPASFEMRQRRAHPSTVAVERRQFHRTPVRIPVSFEWGEGQGEGIVTDISAGGCAIDSKRRLTPGLILRLQLPVGTYETPDATVQQIVSVRSVHGDRVGVEFLASTPQEQMQLIQTITRSIRKFSKK